MTTNDTHHRLPRCHSIDGKGGYPIKVNVKKHRWFHNFFSKIVLNDKGKKEKKLMTVPEMVAEMNDWCDPRYLVCFIDMDEKRKMTKEEIEVDNV